jgi:hypothetical protein
MNTTMQTAATPAPATAAVMEPAELETLAAAALDRLFESLPAPAADELDGDYPGTVLTGAGFESMPSWLAALARRLAAALWRAKSFSGSRGINLWWSPLGLIRRTPYRTAVEDSAIGGGDVLVLDYDLPANPPPARRVRGELRRLGANFYLGRMLLRRGGGGVKLVTYFTLHRRT